MDNFASNMLIFLLILITPAAARPESSLFKLESREEMVHLAGYGEEKLSTVTVSGTILCQSQLHPWPVSGASIGVKCHSREMRRKWRWVHGTTDQNGDFIVDLPSHLHAIPDLHRVCTIKIVRAPKKSVCRASYGGKRIGMKLASAGNGIRRYSAGTIKFVHLQPNSFPTNDESQK